MDDLWLRRLFLITEFSSLQRKGILASERISTGRTPSWIPDIQEDWGEKKDPR